MDLLVSTYKRLNEFGDLETIETATGKVVDTKEAYELTSTARTRYKLSPGIISVIAKLVRTEGLTLSKIAAKEGMPPLHVLYDWKATSEDFRAAMREAEKDRADRFHDKIIDAVDGLQDLSKDEVPASKLYLETLFRLAESDNPEKYKTKPTAGEGGGGSVTIRVDTGIRRDEVVDEGKEGSTIETTDFKEVGDQDASTKVQDKGFETE